VALRGVFLLPFLPLVVADSLFFPFITGKNFLFRVVVEVAVAGWIILACYDPKYRPKFSWVLSSFLAFLGVMALANLLGENPLKSFFSNFERMEGYVTLVHLGFYFILAGTMLSTDRLWNAFWNTSLFVAVGMMFYGFCQLSGSVSCPISQSADRIDGRMGNAAYLAIYMLFHVFISLLLLVRTKDIVLKVVYGLLSVGFVFILVQTGTRGTGLALVGGALIAALYIALFERTNLLVRKVAIGAVCATVLLVGGLYMAKDTAFIKDTGMLQRMISVSLKEGETRFTIWSLALEGVKQRPLLGWGQENFNYVFNKNYEARLYAQEPWFDRVHNLVLDWLIAGGILGFLAYLSIIFSALYYAVVRPLLRKDYEEGSFSVVERGLILGLIAGYIAHNMLVFDNLVSYVLFFSVLAMIHTRFAKDIPALMKKDISPDIVQNIVAPTVVVVFCLIIYFVNIQNITAASDIIRGLRIQSGEVQLASFTKALAESSFADQEIREQLVQATQLVVRDEELVTRLRQADPKLTADAAEQKATTLRNKYIALAESELQKQVTETPDDVRILAVQALFYRTIGQPEKAFPILERALTLSPEKQQILFELGFLQLQTDSMDKAKETFKKAFELEKNNVQARLWYALTAIYSKDEPLRAELITEEFVGAYYGNEMILRALCETKRYPELIKLLEYRIGQTPLDLNLRVSLAAILREAGKVPEAIKVLEKALVEFPDFKTQGEAYIKQLQAG